MIKFLKDRTCESNRWDFDSLDRLRQVHPFPFVMDQDNVQGVVVKDCIGEIVFCEFFCPEKFDSQPFPPLPLRVHLEKLVRARAVARFLVEVSNL